MYYRTQAFRYSDPLLAALAGALKTVPAGALVLTPHLVLYKAGPTPAGGSIIADFTEADFAGYAPAAVVLSGPVVLADGAHAMIGSATWVASSTPPLNPQNVKGYILTDGAGTYYGGEDFSGIFAISAAGQFIETDLVLPIPPRPPVNP